MDKSKVFCIKELRENLNLIQQVTNDPGVYKWYCSKNILEKTILKALNLSFEKVKNDIEKIEYQNKNYYCIYVGDSKNLRRRIISNHLNGSVRTSTFRKTLAAIIYHNEGTYSKEMINNLQDKMLIEICFCANYHEKQKEIINNSFRPLNNQDIKGERYYTDDRHYKKTKNGLKSERITELRDKIK